MKTTTECPHCGEGISKGYAIKALAILAKSEGIDIGEELEMLAGLDNPDEQKAMDVGNKVASHRGKAPGSFTSSARAGGKKGVDRANKPTDPTKEGGIKKSLNLPVIVGDAQLVSYTDASDGVIAKSIEEGNLHTPVARNLRAEKEAITGEKTPE